MMAPTSFAVEHLPCLIGRLDIRPPPGLEALAPCSTTRRGGPLKPHRSAVATAAAKPVGLPVGLPVEQSPMFLDPILTQPFLLSTSPCAVTVDAGFARDAQLITRKLEDLSLGGVSDCSTAIPMAAFINASNASWACTVDEETVMSTSTTGSAEVSPHGSQSSATMLPVCSHDDRAETVSFCGTYSMGSRLHAEGKCKPCDFTRRGGCRAGLDCQFCHLCTPEDAKRKKKEKKKAFRQLKK
eukprot:TRINITY_DN1944_c1_g3_i1.p1 TRINITY_DN1944_c1_g3~~TRINITY_DN1944_c1_g3_i1.p1  ORF type:complete len:241 (+),score=37.99 TRINITY_DN1944_c1_g3_i1:70-792(+)